MRSARARCSLALAAGVFALAGVTRLAYLAVAWKSPAVRYPLLDSQAYHQRALDILAGHWLGSHVYYQDPLYPFVLAGLYALFGPGSPAVLAFQALLDAASATLVFAIAAELFGRRAGLVAGVLAATYSVFFYYDALLLKAPLMVFLVTLSLALVVWAARSGRPAAWAAAGLALGATALTRGNVLLFVPVAIGWIAWAGGGARARRAAAAAALALGVGAVLAPVTLRNWVVGHDFVVLNSQGGQNFFIGNFLGNRTGVYRAPPFLHADPRFEERDFRREAERRSGRKLAPSEVSRYWLRRGLADIAADPAGAARHTLRKLAVWFDDYEVPDNQSFDFFRDEVAPMLRWPWPRWGLVAPLALCGMAFARRDRVAMLLAAFFASYTASVLIFFNLSRLRLPAVPVALVFAGLAVVTLAGRLRAQQWRAAWPSLAFLVLAWPLVHLELTPRDPIIRFFNLGQAHLARAGEHRARAAALSAAGDEPAARLELAQVEAERSQAEARFREGLAIEPRNRRLRAGLHTVYATRYVELERLRRRDEALDVARHFAAEYPVDADAWAFLGSALRRAGHPDDARRALERALRLEPDHARARAELARLRKQADS